MKRKAFTMIEIIYVIVILGILSSIAIPKMIGTTTMAEIAKGQQTLSTVRMAMDAELSKRIMSGDTTPITDLSAGGKPFDYFSKDGRGNKKPIIKYPEPSCTKSGCWEIKGKGEYTFHYGENKKCTFKIKGRKFAGRCPDLKSY
jgi:general secretion pathway protein G